MVASEKLYVNFRSDGRKDGSENEKFYTGDITKKWRVTSPCFP